MSLHTEKQGQDAVKSFASMIIGILLLGALFIAAKYLGSSCNTSYYNETDRGVICVFK